MAEDGDREDEGRDEGEPNSDRVGMCDCCEEAVYKDKLCRAHWEEELYIRCVEKINRRVLWGVQYS